MAIKLEIVTPEKQVLSEAVDTVTVPTLSGEAGILPNHAPLISALKPGILSFSKSGAVQRMVVSGGFVEVGINTVSVLADIAETVDEIIDNIEKLKADLHELEKDLAARNFSIEGTESTREYGELTQARIQLLSSK
jgi:F-type H+-transporting ATPase subunit epsilon